MSWNIGGVTLKSRLFAGTARYPSPQSLADATKAAETDVVTVSLRRHAYGEEQSNDFWQMIKDFGCRVLPNTAGCKSVKEAVTIAHMAREIFNTDWLKLEVVGDDYNLQPCPYGTLEAAEILNKEGFTVFPYCTDDLILCQRLVDVGCSILMPWGSPIGTGKGIINPYALSVLRERFPTINLIVDAGIGKPSHAAAAMEMGFDGVLVNSAIALAADPPKMAEAFAQAVKGGRLAYESGLMVQRELAKPSTPVLGTPFRVHLLDTESTSP